MEWRGASNCSLASPHCLEWRGASNRLLASPHWSFLTYSTVVKRKLRLIKPSATTSDIKTNIKKKSIQDFFVQSKAVVDASHHLWGPPSWFSPLEPLEDDTRPLLLYLPGIDGVGLGLIRHHHSLGDLFHVCCLHIPVKDTTSFLGLVKLVERKVRSEHRLRSPETPIYIIAESLGACIALAVAACNPDMDLVLILSNPGTCFEKSKLQPLLSLLEFMPDHYHYHLILPHILVSLTKGGDPWKMARETVTRVHSLQQDVLCMPYYLSVLADILPRETFLWKLKMLKSAAAWVNARLHVIKAQTLILHSGKDQFLPSQEESQRLCRSLSRCDHRSFSESGHFLFMEEDFELKTVLKGSMVYRRGKKLDWVLDCIQLDPAESRKIFDEYKLFMNGTSPVMLSTLGDGSIVRGLAGIPSESEGPVLYVGYHMLLGLELIPITAQFLYEKGIHLRGLAHKIMFTKGKEGKGILPEISLFDSLRVVGALPVTAPNFFKLMSSKAHVLLYPGGGREACHHKGEEYQLFWPERTEFVRMAARFGATIVPFGVVGEDDVTHVLVDYKEQTRMPLVRDIIQGIYAEVLNVRTEANGEVQIEDLKFPVVCAKPPGRFYFYFGKPMYMKGEDELKDRDKAHELYLQVKSEVEKCISFLKAKREVDPYRHLFPRLAFQAMHGFHSQIPTFDF